MAKTHLRVDFGEFDSPERTPQGYLRADALATRAGIFLYKNKDGSLRRELRHPDDVFAPPSLATLSLVPITDDHPPKLLTAETTSAYMRGYTSEAIERAGAHVKTRVTVTDAALIQAIESGEKRQLSCGYRCEIDPTPGEYLGEPYDCRQTDIVYNHIAVLAKGRAGPNAEIKFDGADVQVPSGPQSQSHSHHDGVTSMDLVGVQIGKITYQVPQTAAQAISDKIRIDEDANSDLQSQLNDLKNQVTSLQEQVENLSGQKEELQETLDAKKKELETAKSGSDLPPEKMDAAINERFKLLSVAQKIIPLEQANFDGVSNKEIRKRVVLQKNPALKERIDSLSDDHINGRFEVIAESLGQSTMDKTVGALKPGASSRNDGGGALPLTAAQARQKMMEESRNAWRTNSNA